MKRLERALEVAKRSVRKNCTSGYAEQFEAEIDAILHPVEVIEEEVVAWQHSTLGDFTNSESVAIKWGECAIRLTGTIRREKKVVERSVEIEVSKIGTVWLLNGEPAHEILGKKGTFEWTE